MTEVERLAAELERAINGDAWHGDAVMVILGRLTFAQANARHGQAHTVRELVRHMTAWTNEARRRLSGAPAGEPEEGDWPAPQGDTPHVWAAEVDALQAAHRSLLDALQDYSEAQLFDATRDLRNGSGAGVTRYVLLHGLVQHHAYHAGQIAILSRIA